MSNLYSNADQSLINQVKYELDFVQSLANAEFVHQLAVDGCLEKPEFIEFLQHLSYWKKPDCIKLLQYPQCLTILQILLEDVDFRKSIATQEGLNALKFQQGTSWIYTDRKPSDFGL